MASRDFIDDAMDIIDQDPELNFMFIGGHFGSRVALARAKIPSLAHLEWLKQRFDEFYEAMKVDLKDT